MNKIILVASFVAVAAASFALGVNLSMNNFKRFTAKAGQTVECSAGGVSLFSDKVPAGYEFSGQVNYSGKLQ